MPVAVWKMHHPCFLCFFDFFYLSHVGGGFRLHDESFCLWGSADIVFGLHSGSVVALPVGTDHCSNAVLSSKADRDKKLNGTNHNEFEVKVKWAGLRSCKQPEDILEKRCSGGASGCLR
jgi:hypothetical protein